MLENLMRNKDGKEANSQVSNNFASKGYPTKPPALTKMNTVSYPSGASLYPQSPSATLKRVKSIPGGMGMVTPKSKYSQVDVENDASFAAACSSGKNSHRRKTSSNSEHSNRPQVSRVL
jgi:hypothetical protein